MAWGTIRFPSRTLACTVEAEVLIPQCGYKSLKQEDHYKVILLLHGAKNDRTEWLMKSQIYDMVRELPVLVFMPSGKNSFYVNGADGCRYMDFISIEIPDLIQSLFPVSDRKEDWLIAGESMGGFGALVCGLNHTDRFGNIACFSGALDVREIIPMLPGIRMEQLFGPECVNADLPENNPFLLAANTEEGKRPEIFLCCGEQDSLIDVNQRFYELLKQKNYNVKAAFGQGAHEFCYWNERLKEMFAWFCEKELKQGFFMGRNGNDFL